MTIETKYNTGDIVWFIENDKVVFDEILKINFSKQGHLESISYYFKEHSNSVPWERFRTEDLVFATKEELIKSL
jgi:hypothetical protein